MFSDLFKLEDRLIIGLRISLALIFLWFGGLKLFGYNPVFEIVNASYPFLADGTGNFILGIIESGIGLGLLINRLRILVHTALFIHLTGTFITFILAPEIMFQPYFPVLTLAGEFVFKNATLAIAGLLVLFRDHFRKASPT